MTYLISLVPSIKGRSIDEIDVDPKAIYWKKLKEQPVRIVYEDATTMHPILRAACANDCWPLDLIDTKHCHYATMFYDSAPHRRFKAKHGIAVTPSFLHVMPTSYARWLIRQYKAS